MTASGDASRGGGSPARDSGGDRSDHETAEYFRAIFESSPDAITIVDASSGVYLDVNPSFTRLNGWQREEVLGRTSTEVGVWAAPEDRERFWRAMQANSRVEAMEVQFRSRDGRIITGLISGEHVTLAGRPCVLTISRDVSELIEVQRALEATQRSFQNLFRQSPDAVMLVDLDSGKVQEVNRAFSGFTGLSGDEILGRRLHEVQLFSDPEERGRLWAQLVSGGRVDGQEIRFSTTHRPHLIASLSASVVEFRGFRCAMLAARDITERRAIEEEKKNLEAQIRQAQKLESLGALAGGIAHDFNNLLTAITGNVSLARVSLPDEVEQAGAFLLDAERAGLRARDLTRRLLTFARGGAPIKRTLELGPLLEEAARFALTGSGTLLTMDLQPALWPVEADIGQVTQVVNNLVLNGVQAMDGRGEVKVQAGNAVVESSNSLGLASGPYVKISVQDRGTGIPPEQLEQIFDPFFTTKEAGTGLGLSSVHSIVRAHGGRVAVQSTVGQGSEFSFWLPASPHLQPSREPRSTTSLRNRNLRVLVLDDEEQIRSFITQSLSLLGNEVVTCSCGEDALELWRARADRGKPFDLAIFDLTVPGGMGGKDTLAWIHGMDPSFPVIASSGYARDPIMANHRAYGFAGCLPKPYTIAELEQALASALNVRPGP